jgi:hypothetical protein
MQKTHYPASTSFAAEKSAAPHPKIGLVKRSICRH